MEGKKDVYSFICKFINMDTLWTIEINLYTWILFGI